MTSPKSATVCGMNGAMSFLKVDEQVDVTLLNVDYNQIRHDSYRQTLTYISSILTDINALSMFEDEMTRLKKNRTNTQTHTALALNSLSEKYLKSLEDKKSELDTLRHDIAVLEVEVEEMEENRRDMHVLVQLASVLPHIARVSATKRKQVVKGLLEEEAKQSVSSLFEEDDDNMFIIRKKRGRPSAAETAEATKLMNAWKKHKKQQQNDQQEQQNDQQDQQSDQKNEQNEGANDLQDQQSDQKNEQKNDQQDQQSDQQNEGEQQNEGDNDQPGRRNGEASDEEMAYEDYPHTVAQSNSKAYTHSFFS